ncbi:MAG: hypothetical protein ACRC92_03610 [Peptostreptococcaceae bacterium]
MSRRIAYGGMLLGVNVILLLLINIIPMNTLFLMGLASLPISVVIMENGPKSGVAFYLASVVLGFIVMNSKSQWILYALTFGVYGLIKYLIEQDRPVYLEYILKIIFANIIIILVYFILRAFVYIPLNLLAIAFFEVAFIVYDYVYSKFIEYYNEKLRKIIKGI